MCQDSHGNDNSVVPCANAPGAVEGGHLAAALDWTESLGLDCRIPIRPDFGEPAAAEDHLNQRGYRRTATAVDAKKDEGIGAATMMLHYEVAQLGFASTYESARGGGAHMALLRRRIVDALAAGAGQLFAVTEEPLDYPDSESTAARNLVRAGFQVVGIRTVWQPPEDLLAADEVEDEEDEEDELDDDDGPDDDHDFEVEV